MSDDVRKKYLERLESLTADPVLLGRIRDALAILNSQPDAPSDDAGNEREKHTDVDCPCNPTIKVINRPNGMIGWISQHHSLRGRESGQ